MGTLLPSTEGYCAPQPESEAVFGRFLTAIGPNLAKVPLVLAVHAPTDTVSSYTDMVEILRKIQSFGGDAKMVTVPEEEANSDSSGKNKSKTGHGYYSFALTKETSDTVLYEPIKAALMSERCIYKNEMNALEDEMNRIKQTAFLAQQKADNDRKLAREAKERERQE